jgi:hypothetical protein
MSGAVLDQHIRQIRNIQICHQDLEPLLPDRRIKIPSSLINAFGAHLQKVLDDAPDGIDDPAIFSSWLGPIVTGTVKDGGIEGSFEEHVLAAVSDWCCCLMKKTGFYFTVPYRYKGRTIDPDTLGYTIVLSQATRTLDIGMCRFQQMRVDNI